MGGIFSGIGQSVGNVLGKRATGALIPGSDPKSPQAKLDFLHVMAAPEKPQLAPVTPLPDQEAIDAEKRRSIAGQRSRSGRANTILTDNGASDTLG